MKTKIIQLITITRYVIQVASFERYFHGLALAALLGLGISTVLANVAISGQVEVLTHLTLSLTELFGLIIVLTMGPRLIIDAINNRQIYLLLARPLPRWVYILGCYLGLVVFIGLCTLVLGGLTTVLRINAGGEIHPVWFGALVTIFLTQITLVAAAMFFSTFSSKLLSAFFTFGLFMGGNGVSLIVQYAEMQKGVFELPLRFASKILPNLESLNLKMAAVYNLPWLDKELIMAVVNCCSWQAVFIIGSILVFNIRNLK